MAIDLPNNGHFVSAGGFNDANITVMLRWRFAALANLQAAASVMLVGSPGNGAFGFGRSGTNFHYYSVTNTGGFGATNVFIAAPAGVWNASAMRAAGTALTSWNNETKTGPLTHATMGKNTGLNFYLNHDIFGSDHQGDYDVADVIILHTALSDDEITAYCTRGFSGEFWAHRAMSYWPMISWDGSPVRDRRGYRDLTLTAGTAARTDHPRIILPAEAA